MYAKNKERGGKGEKRLESPVSIPIVTITKVAVKKLLRNISVIDCK